MIRISVACPQLRFRHLPKAAGKSFDTLFLPLMIKHHEGRDDE